MSARRSTDKGGNIRGLFTFALLAAFALLSLVVVVIGARSYRMINASAERAFVYRTGMSYLIGKVRGADEAGTLEIINEGGNSVLALAKELEGERYLTYIYCDGSAVREYFARADLAFSPDYGEKIFEASGMTITLDNGLLEIAVVDASGETHATSIFLQTAKEGGA